MGRVAVFDAETKNSDFVADAAEAMAEEEEEKQGAGVARALQELHDRGRALWTLIVRLPSQVITPDCRARLLKAVNAERKFVDRLLSSRDLSAVADAHLSRFGSMEHSLTATHGCVRYSNFLVLKAIGMSFMVEDRWC